MLRRCRSLTAASAAVYYDDARHEYRLRGVTIPSVTQVLTLTGRIDTRWFTPAGTERGRLVHAWAEQLDEYVAGQQTLTQFNERLVPEAIGGYVEAYRMLLRDARPAYDAIERAYWHPVLRYGGRPDRGIRRWPIADGPATLELKSGAEEAWHGVQLAGYERLRRRGSRWVCYLQANGRYKLRQMTNADDHQEFLRALREAWAIWPAQAATA